MDASALVSRFGMSPEEERQFRLNLENKAYASGVFDETIYSALFNLKRLYNGVRRLLTRDIKEPDNQPLSDIVGKGGGRELVVLAVLAGADPNHVVCPLGHAILTGSLNLVSLLLDLGADPNSLFQFLWVAMQEGFHDGVELLVRRGLQVNRVISYTTPLGIATSVGDCQFINFFLDHGANPNFIRENKSTYFETPLEIAIRHQNRTCLELLLQRGANPNTHCESKIHSPFMLAILHEDISFAQVLLAYGADWRTCDFMSVSTLPFERFEWFVENSGYAPNVPAPEGESLLELVTSMGYERKVELLISRGALISL